MYLCTQEKKYEQEVGLGFYLKAVTQRTYILLLNSYSLLKQFTSQVNIQAQAYRDTSHSDCSSGLKVK